MLVASRGAVLRSDLNTISLIVDIKDSLLYLVVYLPSRVDEGLLHVSCGLSRRLHKDQAVFPGEGLAFLPFNISSSLEVAMILKVVNHLSL